MNIPDDLLYTKDHEWAKIDGDSATIGITDYAQAALGDITFVDVPKVGSKIKQFEWCATVESVKAASDVYAPLSGKVVGRNTVLEGAPETINKDPYGEGWIAKVELGKPAEAGDLMDAAAYEKYVEEEAHK